MRFNLSKFRDDLDAMMKEAAPDGYRFACATEDTAHMFGDSSTFELNRTNLQIPSTTLGYGSGGFSRIAIDAPQMAASINDRFDIASMSKTITAAAVLSTLQAKDLPITTLVKDFMPAGWVLHPTVQTLTFEDFMRHKTGFAEVNDGHDFNTIKNSMQTGPKNPAKAAHDYRNINYAAFRIILPILNSYNRFTKKVTFVLTPNVSPEEVYAYEYMKVVNQRVLVPSGIVGANCNSRSRTSPFLYEYHHDPAKHGSDFLGNNTLTSGAHGWAISVVDYVKFIQTFLFTEIIVSDGMKQLMFPTQVYPDPGLGMYMSMDSIGGFQNYGHGGWIPYSNGVQIASWWFCFKPVNLIVAALSNAWHKPSPHPNWADSCVKIYREAWVSAIRIPGRK